MNFLNLLAIFIKTCNFAAVLTAIRVQRYVLIPKFARKYIEFL